MCAIDPKTLPEARTLPASGKIAACQKTGCSALGEAEKPTPVRVLPEAVRLVMAWMPGPVRPWPAGSAACQAEPFGDEAYREA